MGVGKLAMIVKRACLFTSLSLTTLFNPISHSKKFPGETAYAMKTPGKNPFFIS